MSDTISIAICGGGVAGLTLARALVLREKKASPCELHFSVDLYEAAKHFEAIGSAITISGQAFRVLEGLALLEECKKIDISDKGLEDGVNVSYRKSDIPEGHEFLIRRFGRGQAYHRAAFHELLAGSLDSSTTKVHFNKRLVSFSVPGQSPSPPFTLHFADGSTATCDVLIGCDGIRSAVRTSLYELRARQIELESREADVIAEAGRIREFAKPVWSGMVIYRSMVPTSRVAGF